VKFILNAVGFALAFALLDPVDAPALFAGFIAMLLVNLAGGVWLLRRGVGGMGR
jgi:ATP synthase protein I